MRSWTRDLVREIEALRAAVDPLDPFRPLVGAWRGTLTYTDYGDDATRVTLGARARIAEAPGGAALTVAMTYTEPDGREVGVGTDRLEPGTDPSVFGWGGASWRVVARDTTVGALKLVVERDGEDNDRAATIRETLTATADAWSLVKEVRYDGAAAFFERNRHVFTRDA